MRSGKVGGHAAEDKKNTSSTIIKSYRKKRSFYRWPISYILVGDCM